jgi:arsenite-transporting ATPase
VRTVLYTGKGGVGKTTTAAATAVTAAARGRRTLILSADAAHSLGDVLGEPVGAEPKPVAQGLYALEVDARSELEGHWGRIRDYLVALFRYQGIEEVVAEELALLPGAEELAALLSLEAHGQSGRFDVVVVDCAPTDSTLRLVTLPEAARGTLRLLLRLQRAISAVVSPIAGAVLPVPLPRSEVFRDVEHLLYRRLRAIRALLRSSSTSVRLVVTPERMVIDEACRAHTDLALFDVRCDAVVMNRLLPPEAAAESFFQDWASLQQERCAEVETLFAPLPLLRAPLQDDEVVGVDRLERHGEELFGSRDPAALLCQASRLRFLRDGEGYRVDVPLPHADPAQLDVAKVEGELLIRTGRLRRAVSLPRHLNSLSLLGARLEHDCLRVRLGAAGAT